MDNCKIVEDLMPSYCDGLTSEESNAMIKAHVVDCPRCAQLLDKMSAEPKREVLDHREQFRRTIKMYEQNHKVKSLRIRMAVIAAIAVILLIWANSFALAASFSGIREKSMHIVAESEESNGTTYRFAVVSTGEGEFALAKFKKYPIINFWVLDSFRRPSEENGFVVDLWFGPLSGQSYYEKGMELTVNFQHNALYVGNNAKEPIILASEDLPGDVAVMVHQVANYYWIHTVTDNDDVINHFRLYELLQAKGFIE